MADRVAEFPQPAPWLAMTHWPFRAVLVRTLSIARVTPVLPMTLALLLCAAGGASLVLAAARLAAAVRPIHFSSGPF